MFDDFFAAAREKLDSALAYMPDAPETSSSGVPTVGSQIFEAIYQYGAGRMERAREKVVGGFLMTTEGQRMQGVATAQTVQKYIPHIVIGIVLVLIAGMFIGKR